jgi:hypothetical protein
MPSQDYEINSVILCDDIRREDNGKDMLIGVYNGVIAVEKIPAFLPSFALRFVMKLARAGNIKLEAAIVQPDGVDIVQFGSDINVMTTKFLAAVTFKAVPMVFSMLGRHEIKVGPAQSRETVGFFEVITREEMTAELNPHSK